MTTATIQPGFYLKCGSHFMSIHNYKTSYLTMNTCTPPHGRFDTELEALQARDAAIAKEYKCPRLIVVEIGECEMCEAIGPLTHVGNRVLCETCAEPDENACEVCGHQDGTHYEGKRWTCDDCANAPDDVQEGD